MLRPNGRDSCCHNHHGNIARAFGFDGNPLAMQTSSGRSYFLTRLLADVIFGEQALAGTNLPWEKRRQMPHWAGPAPGGGSKRTTPPATRTDPAQTRGGGQSLGLTPHKTW